MSEYEIHEIRVTPIDDDPLGRDILAEIEHTLGERSITAVRTATVYRVQGVSEADAYRLAQELFTDPLSEHCTVNQAADHDTPHIRQVGFLPGVMNPAAASIMHAAHDLGIQVEAADSSREYAFHGEKGLTSQQVDTVVGQLLVNKTVERVVNQKPASLIIEGSVGAMTIIPIREASDAELAELAKDKLFLDADEMHTIQGYFKRLGRDPKDAELEHIAAAWSEHCGHKTFKAQVHVERADGSVIERPPLIQRIIAAAKAQPNYERLVVSAFDDNSGVLRFYDGQAICGKVETHNSPSAIEPYGGAMTGSGGVFRDIMGTGKGAKTLISTDMFCFAPPDIDDAILPPGTLRPRYLQRRVVQGVRDYGNRMGIPTANGSFHYHEDFRARPTVMVGAYGILPETYADKGKPQVGDIVVTIGGRTGRDGIHGATFSSGEMTERTATVNSSAVQIGNAIEEKRVSDALLEARDKGYIRALTDCGAAGFASAIGEIGEDTGITIDISSAPLKYSGMSPWEIWMSESQERMVAAIPPEKLADFMDVCRKYNVEATSLGLFDGTGRLTVNYDTENIIDLDYEFLRHGLPQRIMRARWEQTKVQTAIPEAPADEAEWIDRLKRVLAHGNVCSKEPVVRQYDHGVQGGNIVAPYGGADQSSPNDALVIRPILGKPYGVVQSHGMNPILNRLNPYEGTIWAITEAAANYVAVGGDITEAAAVGNYIWPFPDEEAMGSLDRSVDAAVYMMYTLGLPVISGKDSLSSTYRGNGEVIKIPPVYTMSIFGRIPDVEKTMTADIKQPGNSTLYLVGTPDTGMGGSAYYDVCDGQSSSVPQIDTRNLSNVLAGMHNAIQGGDILACHDVSEGGVVTAIAEMCFGSNNGVQVQIPSGEDAEAYLYNETAGCFVVEIDNAVDAETALAGLPFQRIGVTSSTTDFTVHADSRALYTTDIRELKEAWQTPMKGVFHA